MNFDVFLSYSRSDKRFVTALARQLGRYTPPGSLGLPARRLQPFMDSSDLVGTDYDSAIQRSLAASRKLIVVCTPAARASSYVNDEIRRFLQLPGRSAADVIALLLAGRPNNEVNDDPADSADPAAGKAFPEVLCEAMVMPLAVDYRGCEPGHHKLDDGAYANAWFVLLANLLGVDRAALEEREAKRRRQRRWVIGGITGSVMAALATLAGLASWQRSVAVEQRQNAYARQLAAQAEVALADGRAAAEPALERALAALQLQAGNAPLEAVQALGHGIGRLPPRHLARLELPDRLEPPQELGFTADGTQIIGLGAAELLLWQADDGRLLQRRPLPFRCVLGAIASQGRPALWLLDEAGQLWSLDDPAAAPQPRLRVPAGEHAVALRPDDSAGGGLLVTRRERDGGLSLRQLATGVLLHALESRLGSEFIHWLPGPKLLQLAGGKAAAGDEAALASRLISLDGQPLLHLGQARAADWQLSEMGQVGRQDPIIALAASADGQRIATARQDGRVSLWHPTTRTRPGSWGALPLPELESVLHLDHGDELGAARAAGAPAVLALSPDGRHVAAQSLGLRLNPVGGIKERAPLLRIWNVDEQREIARLHPAAPLQLRFAPQGDRLLTIGPTPTGGVALEVWQLEPQAGVPRPQSSVRQRLALPDVIQADAVRQRGHAQLAANGQRAVWLGPDLKLRLWNAGSAEVQILDQLAEPLRQSLDAQQADHAAAAQAAFEQRRLPEPVPVAQRFQHWREQELPQADATAAVPVPLAISPDACCAVLALGDRLRFYDLAARRLRREQRLAGLAPLLIGRSHGAVLQDLLLSEGGRYVAFNAIERTFFDAMLRNLTPEEASRQPWMSLLLYRSEDLHLLHREAVPLAMAAPLPVLALRPLAIAPDGSGLAQARVLVNADPLKALRLQVQAVDLQGRPPRELLSEPWAFAHPDDLGAALHTVSVAYGADAGTLSLRQTEAACAVTTGTDMLRMMTVQQAGCERVQLRYRRWNLRDGSLQAELQQALTLPAARRPRPSDQQAAMAGDPQALLPVLALPAIFVPPVPAGSPFVVTTDLSLISRERDAASGPAMLQVLELRSDLGRLQAEVCARLPAALRGQAPSWADQYPGAAIGPVCAGGPAGPAR